MLVFGGLELTTYGGTTTLGGSMADLWDLNLRTRQWTELHSAHSGPSGRFSHATSVIEGDDETLFVVFGGRHVTEVGEWTMESDVWLLPLYPDRSADGSGSLSVGLWRDLPFSPAFGRSYQSMVAVEGSFWAFGGLLRATPNQDSQPVSFVFNEVLTADPYSPLWMKAVVDQGLGLTPEVRFDHSAVAWRDKMVVYGGLFQTVLGDVWALNTTRAALIEAPPDSYTNYYERLFNPSHFLVAVLMALFMCFFVFISSIRRNAREQQQRELELQLGLVLMGGLSGQPARRRGLSSSQLEAFPVVEYTPQGEGSSEEGGREQETTCCICLCDYDEGELLRALPCSHLFHIHCIDTWLGSNMVCPMCKADLSGAPTDNSNSDQLRQPDLPPPTDIASLPQRI